jgi:hypothetical protein
MDRYTDDELSRILSESANGTLGKWDNTKEFRNEANCMYCIEEAARGTDWRLNENSLLYDEAMEYTLLDTKDPVAVLRWLEENGMA